MEPDLAASSDNNVLLLELLIVVNGQAAQAKVVDSQSDERLIASYLAQAPASLRKLKFSFSSHPAKPRLAPRRTHAGTQPLASLRLEQGFNFHSIPILLIQSLLYYSYTPNKRTGNDFDLPPWSRADSSGRTLRRGHPYGSCRSMEEVFAAIPCF